MQTYSHALVNAAAGERLLDDRGPRYGALVLGGLLPDVPLLLLSALYVVYQASPLAGTGGTGLLAGSYDALYFGHPVWITSHNLLHAPLSLAVLAGAGGWALRRGHAWGELLLWLLAGAALHSAIDILTHHGDGPLLLFPVQWSVRYESPISYWNPGHGAEVVAAAEHLLDLGILAYFGWQWRGHGLTESGATE